MIRPELLDRLRVKPGKKFRLKDHDPGWELTEDLKLLGKDAVKERAKELMVENLKDLSEAQDVLYAGDKYAVLIVFQAMDAAGKDGTIKHVMSGVNPQGCQVYSFKQPSKEDLDHTFLWRCSKCMPERGRIGIFNRSYYEDVLVVKVHPQLLAGQALPREKFGKKFWNERYDDINSLERHLTRNGTVVIKFFLNVSKDEQKRRFLDRLEVPDKNWKFSPSDLAERAFWDDYMDAYESAIEATSTEEAPWYIIPADHKWAARALVADVITTTIRKLDLKFPEVTPAKREALAEAKKKLLAEED